MKPIRLLIGVCVVSLFSGNVTHADEPAPLFFELGAKTSVAWARFDSLRNADTGHIAGLAFAGMAHVRLYRWLGVQLEIEYLPRGADVLSSSGSSLGSYELRYIDVPLLATARLPRALFLTPYLVAGPSVGFNLQSKLHRGSETVNDSATTNRLHWAILAGAGASMDITRSWALTFEARYEHGLSDIYDTENDILTRSRAVSLLAGFSWSPGRDTDGDGLRNRRVDRCWTLAEDLDGFEDGDGCPDPDNDADGIADIVDQCQNQREDLDGYRDQDGCPDQDNDGDGLLDWPDANGDWIADTAGHIEDACPSQAFSRLPDRETNGCFPRYERIEVKAVIARDEHGIERIERIEAIEAKQSFDFANSKHELTEEHKRLLDDVARALQDHPEVRVLVRGHADGEGNTVKNERLSQRRADAARMYLLERGLAACRLVAKGVGELAPVAHEDSEAARHANRRVDFEIIRTRAHDCPSGH